MMSTEIFMNEARIQRDHPFGFIRTEVRISQSTQIIESGLRIRMDNCQPRRDYANIAQVSIQPNV
eukprot:6207274-Pleurochrysis_carterae.AAC.1